MTVSSATQDLLKAAAGRGVSNDPALLTRSNVRLLQNTSKMPKHGCGNRADEPDKKRSAIVQARGLVSHLRGLGFQAYLDLGALCLGDNTGWRRELCRFIPPAIVFEVLNAGLDDDPMLLDRSEDSQ